MMMMEEMPEFVEDLPEEILKAIDDIIVNKEDLDKHLDIIDCLAFNIRTDVRSGSDTDSGTGTLLTENIDTSSQNIHDQLSSEALNFLPPPPLFSENILEIDELDLPPPPPEFRTDFLPQHPIVKLEDDVFRESSIATKRFLQNSTSFPTKRQSVFEIWNEQRHSVDVDGCEEHVDDQLSGLVTLKPKTRKKLDGMFKAKSLMNVHLTSTNQKPAASKFETLRSKLKLRPTSSTEVTQLRRCSLDSYNDILRKTKQKNEAETNPNNKRSTFHTFQTDPTPSKWTRDNSQLTIRVNKRDSVFFPIVSPQCPKYAADLFQRSVKITTQFDGYCGFKKKRNSNLSPVAIAAKIPLVYGADCCLENMVLSKTYDSNDLSSAASDLIDMINSLITHQPISTPPTTTAQQPLTTLQALISQIIHNANNFIVMATTHEPTDQCVNDTLHCVARACRCMRAMATGANSDQHFNKLIKPFCIAVVSNARLLGMADTDSKIAFQFADQLTADYAEIYEMITDLL